MVNLFSSIFSGNLTDSSPLEQAILEAQNIQNGNLTAEEAVAASALLLSHLNKLKVQEPQGTPNPASQGVVYSPDPLSGWIPRDAALAELLGLDFRAEFLSDPVEDNLIHNIQDSLAAKRPFLTYFWTPHQLLDPRSGVNITRMQLMDWTDTCNENIDQVQCIYPVDVLVNAISKRLMEISPSLFKFMCNLKYRSNQDQIGILGDVLYDGMTHEEAACKWIKDNYAYIESLYPPVSPLEILDYQATAVAGVLAGFSALLISVSIALAIFLNLHRRNQVVMAASLPFCNIMLLGSLLGYVAVFMFLGTPTRAHCALRPFLICLGFSLMYSYLLIKTFRIWRIFKKPFAASNVWLSDLNLALAGAAVVLLELLLVSIWVGANPPVPKYIELVDHVELSCISPDPLFEGIITWLLFGINVVLVILGAFLAFDTRHVNSIFRESRYIGFAIYNMVALGTIFVPFIALEVTTKLNRTIILCCAVMLIPAFTVLTLFIPKVVYILRPDLAPAYDSDHNPAEKGSASKQRGNRGSEQLSVSSEQKQFQFALGTGKQKGKDPMVELEISPSSPKPSEELEVDVLEHGLQAMRTGEYDEAF